VDIGEEYDADDDPALPHRFHRVAELLDQAASEDLLLIDEPSTFAEAEPHECWRTVMVEELVSTEENGTWTLTDLPAGHRPIELKWVFKTKRDAAGAVVKHKARLVATCSGSE
jgi:hypothetical protein